MYLKNIEFFEFYKLNLVPKKQKKKKKEDDSSWNIWN